MIQFDINMKDGIAVILPIYEKDRLIYIKQSVDSILSQTYKTVNIYIGVDGHIEKEMQDCLRIYENVDKIRIIYFSENRGLAAVLNDLILLCHKDGFEYIARMDADDISLPTRLEKQMFFLKTHPEVDVVGGTIEEIDEKGELRGKTVVYPATSESCRRFFAYRNPHAHPAVLFRYRFFEKAGCLYRSEYRQNQDTMLWFDGLKKGVIMANISDVVLQFRITNDLFKKRRNGWNFAKKQLRDRMIINKELRYGIGAYVFAYFMFFLLVSPPGVKKFAYRIFR